MRMEPTDNDLLRTYSIRKVRRKRRKRRPQPNSNTHEIDERLSAISLDTTSSLLPQALHHKNLRNFLDNVDLCCDIELQVSDKKLTEEITMDILESVDSMWEKECNREVCVIDDQHCTLENIKTLKDGEWIDDVVVNCYLKLIAKRSQANPKMPKVYSFDALFYPMLSSGGCELAQEFTKDINVFDYEIIIIPVHDADHWSLACVLTNQKKVVYIDSLGHRNDTCVNMIFEFIDHEHCRVRNESLPGDWNAETIQRHIPTQKNFNDCGIFMLLFAEHIARRNYKFEFTSEFIPLYRRRICYEIKIGYLLRRRYSYRKALPVDDTALQQIE